jgi:hypothetical protein
VLSKRDTTARKQLMWLFQTNLLQASGTPARLEALCQQYANDIRAQGSSR